MRRGRMPPGIYSVHRMADATEWHDPATGYRRRQITGPRFPADIAEVRLPPGGRVPYRAASLAFQREAVWVLDGRLTFHEGDVCTNSTRATRSTSTNPSRTSSPTPATPSAAMRSSSPASKSRDLSLYPADVTGTAPAAAFAPTTKPRHSLLPGLLVDTAGGWPATTTCRRTPQCPPSSPGRAFTSVRAVTGRPKGQFSAPKRTQRQARRRPERAPRPVPTSLLLCQLKGLVTTRQRRTRGIPRPIHEMISRWISLLPPPKVKMTADR